ncbi:MAG: DUF5050 domain-containing protein [Clostridia bacterium]|nr:DUF5050 domain-containing protein [Clostridia bacterium]
MKKTFIAILAVLLLGLAGCSDRVTQQSESSSFVSEQSEIREQGGSFEETFLISGFDGKTSGELADRFTHVIYYNESIMEGVMNTPSSLLINTMNDRVLLSYDKTTGVFSDACRDPLCDHESCVWASSGNRIYRGADGLFFLADEEDKTVLYHTDFNGANIKKLYTSVNMLSYVVQEGSYVYFLEEVPDEETDLTVSRIVRMSPDSTDTDVLLERVGLYYFMPLGGNILYLDPDDGHMLFDTQTKQKQPFGPSEMLPLALCGEDFYYENDGALFCASAYGAGDAVMLTDQIRVSELLFDGGMIYYHDGKTVYKASADFTEITEIYTAKTDERIPTVIVDDSLLFYRYTVRKGSSSKHHFVFADLQTGKTLEVVND